MDLAVVDNEGRTRGHIPGEAGIWLVVLADMCVFSVLFVVFLLNRNVDVALFNSSQLTLDRNIGVLNTLLLLTSSLLVARGVHSFRSERGNSISNARWFVGAMACGAGFLVNKVVEYGAKVSEQILPSTNDFYMYYYVLTGLHMLHVLIGMVVLLLVRNTVASGADPASKRMFVESSATYWHMVDLLWIILFPLIYLID